MSSAFEGHPGDFGKPFSREGSNEDWHDLEPDEQEALKRELKNVRALDFERYLSDHEYKFYIEENPQMQKLRDNIMADALRLIDLCAADVGLSREQVDRLVALFDPDVQTYVAESRRLEEEIKPIIKRAIEKDRTENGGPPWRNSAI